MVSRHFDGSYQKTMIQTANTLLAEKGVNYIAGIPFIYNKDQGVDGLQNLISPAIDYLYHPRDSLKPLMLDSLGLSTLEIEDIRYDFEAKPVKLIINNYRMMSLPPMLRNYIHANYQQFYGSIYLYAPEVLSSQISFHLKFGGRYRIKSDARHTILLDKKHFHNNEIIKLKKGDHLTKSKTNYRLILVPDNAVKLDPRYREDKWKKMIKSVNLL